MLAHECVRKLMARCGSRFGASRSAIRTIPPRLGDWARASGAASRALSRAAQTANARRRAMTDPPLLVSVSTLTEKERNGPEKVAPLCPARGPCQCTGGPIPAGLQRHVEGTIYLWRRAPARRILAGVPCAI